MSEAKPTSTDDALDRGRAARKLAETLGLVWDDLSKEQRFALKQEVRRMKKAIEQSVKVK